MPRSTFVSTSSSKAGLLLLLFIIAWIVLTLKLLSPPDVVPASVNDQFSAERALQYLKVIAAEPHSSGTPAHAKVRDYILDFCKKQGLETQLQEVTGLQVFGGRARAGRAQNILVRLPGTGGNKSILVMGHYDSQPNTPGATDDGTGVAAMMEVMRMVESGPPLKNDVLFLFTDLEESGLFGAEGFVNHYKELNKIGLLLNFEARGNAGVAFTFEVTDNNSWLMHNFSQGVGKAFANSIAYEVYKRMPNGTDFTCFKSTGIEGYNSAFIDGFTYYHSMADRVENMDVRSLQNHGDILLRSLKHFGNINLDTPHPKENAIFFNPIGNWLWIYPISWDIPLMVVCFLLFALVVTIGIKRGRVKVLKLLAGVGLFLGFIVTSMILVWFLEKTVLALYPYYSNFDGLNSYNALYYLISIAGVIVLCFSLWYSKAVKSSTYESLFMGGIFVLMVVMVCIKLFFPTGAYLFHYPLIVALIFYLILYFLNIQEYDRPLVYSLFQMAILIPALSLWVPIAYILFVTFSHTMPFAAAVLIAFCAPLLIPSLRIIRSFNRWAVVGVAGVLLVGGLVLAQLNSAYSKERPLPTYLTYSLDVDTNSASWISDQEVKDEWMEQFIKSTKKEKFEWYRGFSWPMWRGDAPVINSSIGSVKTLKDTVYNNSRFLKLLITGDSATNTIDFTLSPQTFIQKINERPLPDGIWRLSFWSMPAKGIEVEIKTVPGQLVSMSMIERKMGLPNSLIEKRLPDNMIYGQGTMSNTTQIRRKVSLQ